MTASSTAPLMNGSTPLETNAGYPSNGLHHHSNSNGNVRHNSHNSNSSSSSSNPISNNNSESNNSQNHSSRNRSIKMNGKKNSSTLKSSSSNDEKTSLLSDKNGSIANSDSQSNSGSQVHQQQQQQQHLKTKPKEWATLVLKKVFIALVHTIVVLYTYLTLPIYYLVQKPWIRRKEADYIRATQENPNDPSSPWVSTFSSKYEYVLDHVESIDDLLNNLGSYFNLDRKALGYRRVLAEHPVLSADGKTPHRIDGRPVTKRELSEYEWISYEDMIKRRVDIARGLHLEGIKQRDRVVILCDTCAEYMMMQLAIANAGAVQVNVFSTLGDSGIAHAVRETRARVIFTSFELLPKTRAIIIANDLDIDKVIYIPRKCENVLPEVAAEDQTLLHPIHNKVKFISLIDLEKNGKINGKLVQADCKPIGKDEVAFIMYTSGTTGVPKGVQATSYQYIRLLHTILPVLAHIMGTSDQHVYVAYLPQAHIFEATCEFLAIALGAPIGFATPFTLSDSSPGLAKGQISDMRLLQPTIMIAVPLVLERMKKEIFAKLDARSPISAPLFNYLMDYKIRWMGKGYKTPIVNFLLCRKISEQFGGRLEKMIIGGAPLSASLQALIKAALNTTLVQGYGMTETLGACLCMDDVDLSYGRCGRPLRGVYARLDDWIEGGYRITDQPHPRGELVIGSKANSLSYLDKPEMNAELYEFDDKRNVRWFKTGDVAEVYPDGTFKIIDRKKDLVKLANGEYFSLGKIESVLKNCSYVDNICVFGNALANYLVALVVPNANRFGKLAKMHKVPRSEAADDPRMVEFILKSIKETGLKNGLKKAEIPTKVFIVSDEWTPDNGLLTAALKLKRSLIKSKYENIIQDLFNDNESEN